MYMLINQLDIVINAIEVAHTEEEKDTAISLIALIVEYHKSAIRRTKAAKQLLI